MKILYAIQGTGNGHISRSRDIVPLLKKRAEVDVMVSGLKTRPELPFDITYTCKGLGYTFGKKGGIDFWESWKKAEFRNAQKEIRDLPISQYDLLINDFEPISAWAAKINKVPSVSLSHQAAVLHKNAPRPKHPDLPGKAVLKYYAPTEVQYGFHFESYDEKIYTPVIRQEVREQEVKNKGHYTVYLPAYSLKKLILKLGRFEGAMWQIFSPKAKEAFQVGDIEIFPTHNKAFIKSMAESLGVLCGAGFETPAEALYLGKKLMVVPMKTQYEQQCNAAALKKIGVPVLKNLKEKRLPELENWLNSTLWVSKDYPDHLESIIDGILNKASNCDSPAPIKHLDVSLKGETAA
ncbi:MAG: glycosyltransferase family protein [Bacteroidota bacterium]